MDSKIIELLKLKGMGNISSFLLQNYWTVSGVILVLIIGLWITFFAMDDGNWELIYPLAVLAVIIDFAILFTIGTGVQTPLNNLQSVATDKNINITEFHGNYIIDKNNNKYKIGLLRNANTSSFYKRAWFKDQINGHYTKVKIIKYKGDNIIINYTPQKRTVRYDN